MLRPWVNAFLCCFVCACYNIEAGDAPIVFHARALVPPYCSHHGLASFPVACILKRLLSIMVLHQPIVSVL